MTKTDFLRGMEIATELTVLKNELGRLGLFATMHALDGATRAIGYELAEHYPRKSHEGRRP